MTACAAAVPEVERSTKTRTPATPATSVAAAFTVAGLGRLAITTVAPVAASRIEPAARAPLPTIACTAAAEGS